MKKFLGFIGIAICLTAAIIAIFIIWDIAPVNWVLIRKIAITGAIVTGAFFIGWLCYNWFFTKEDAYNKSIGNKAHPKN